MTDKPSTAEDLAASRTDMAEDRTAMANERTFAGWVRTAMAAIGIGLGFHALFNAMTPTWAPKAIATVFIALGVFLVMAAERRACATFRRLDTHAVEVAPRMNLKILTGAIALAAVGLIAAIWILV